MTNKILIIASQSESLINFRLSMLLFLQSRGYTVMACAPQLDKKVAQILQKHNIEFKQVPIENTGMNVLKDFRSVFALRRVIQASQADMVFSYTVKPVIYGSIAARLAGIRGIYSLITGLGYVFANPTLKGKLLRFIVKCLYRGAFRCNHAVIFQNPDDRNLFIQSKILPKGKAYRVFGSGVDLVHFAIKPLPKAPVFLLIARLLADKGIREYVEAVREVKKKHPQVKFLLVGWIDSNPAAIKPEELKAWQDEGVIEFLGRVDDVRPAIARSSVYVLPSYREGTPRSVLEAMSMGRAIITTDAPGCRETVADGENGFLVKVKDVESLTNAMLKFIENPELIGTMGAVSRALAKERFDVNKVNQDIFDIINDEKTV